MKTPLVENGLDHKQRTNDGMNVNGCPKVVDVSHAYKG
jgi:hypothetical protein